MNQIGTKYILAQRFVFDPNNNSLTDQTKNNEITRLGSNESRILLMLAERPNQVISRDQLHEFVWREQGFQVDDSSLTQAISTLRKMLGDSTKSPAFVKTVPKRGYQFIASVSVAETAKPEAYSEEVTEDEPSDKSVSAHSLSENNSAGLASSQGASLESKTATFNAKEPLTLLAKIALVLAIIIPLTVYLTLEPAKARFRLIDTIEDVPLMTTEGHPPLDSWHDQIKQCVTVYLKNHENERRPQKMIVTAGPRNNLMLNVVHSEEFASESVTIQLVASQQDLAQLCD
ncbi:transcriptional regulator [Vibrio hannami]|uniref:winged helix-turn-helix domain-containing protein n=1 Tax=Vibrio hannami TaxID=2717094 RepID=UPI00240FA0D9|nr:transcriptional regulator [Vibrio hannami]MDG3088718.1 transcriptional regulator [Vibrio hannami]